MSSNGTAFTSQVIKEAKASKLTLNSTTAKKLVDAVRDAMVVGLRKDGVLELVGFGTFTTPKGRSK